MEEGGEGRKVKEEREVEGKERRKGEEERRKEKVQAERVGVLSLHDQRNSVDSHLSHSTSHAAHIQCRLLMESCQVG